VANFTAGFFTSRGEKKKKKKKKTALGAHWIRR
jgi:hypothetical protein